MTVRRVLSPLSSAQPLRAALAGALAAIALPAAAAQGGLLEITVGPHETSWLHIQELAVRLDGAPLQVALPGTGADPAVPVFSDAVKPGAHHLEVKAGFTGDSKAFSYVEGYVFRMTGAVDVDVPAAEAVGVNVRAITVSGLTVEWSDRFKLAVRTARYTSEKAVAARVPEEAAPGATAAAARPLPKPVEPRTEPVPAAFVARQGAGACVLQPLRFAFDRHDLDAAAREELDAFAACLVDSGDAAVIGGHADPRGNARHNEQLSARRAREVVAYLAGKGVARSRLATRAFGSTRLACTERTPECDARNRRAEAVVSQP